MSITSSIYTANSGLLADAAAINVIGNNLANQNTIGFKSGETVFSTLLSQSIGNNSQVGTGVQVQAVQNQFSSGTLESTTNVTDLAIQGNGFFALAAPGAASATAVANTQAYYTQAGSFSVSAPDATDTFVGLVNPSGYQVLDTAGMPIQFPISSTDASGNACTFQNISAISSTGVISLLYTDNVTGSPTTVYYNGNVSTTTTAPTVATATPGQLIAETDIPNAAGMQSQGGTLFTLTAASGTPAAPAGGGVFAAANGTTESINSNSLEESNVDMGSELVNLINVQTAYSANSKTITTANELSQDVLNLIR